jgi:hypothetical protein
MVTCVRYGTMLPMSTSPASGSYHHGDLRNALLDAASELAGESDAAALALRAVARRAGVSHDAGRRAEAVLRALIAERFRLRGADLDRAVLACWSQMHGMAVLIVETPAMKNLDRTTASAMARDAAGVLELSLTLPARPAPG